MRAKVDKGSGLYMTAQEVAEALGVSVSTVYVYVSRKLLRSEKLPGSRTARYFRSDVTRLQQRSTSARFSADTLAPQPQIVTADDSHLYYRGKEVRELSEHSTLEDVACLLWQVPQAFDGENYGMSVQTAAVAKVLPELTATEKALVLFPLMEREDRRALDLSRLGAAATGANVMRWFASWVAGRTHPSNRAIHEVVTANCPDGACFSDFVRRLLVMTADHPLDPTVYAVRAAANTGISPYRAAMSGLIASAGRRLSFARQAQTLRFIDDILNATDPEDVIVQRMRDGDTLPGFSAIDDAPDFRAEALLDQLRAGYLSDPDTAKFLHATAVVAELDRRSPTISLIHLFTGTRLSLGTQRGMLVRLSRMAGWIAHSSEQYLNTEAR